MAEIVATAGELRVTRVREWRKTWFRFRQSNLSLLGFGIIAAVILAAVFAPQLAPFPHHAGIFVDFDHALKGPSAHNWLGTDDAGRDIFSRVLFGARISLILGLMVLIIAVAVGVPLALVAGYWGGRAGDLIMRVTDACLAVPRLAPARALPAALPPRLNTRMLA